MQFILIDILRKDEIWREEIDKIIYVILDKYVKKKKNGLKKVYDI